MLLTVKRVDFWYNVGSSGHICMCESLNLRRELPVSKITNAKNSNQAKLLLLLYLRCEILAGTCSEFCYINFRFGNVCFFYNHIHILEGEVGESLHKNVAVVVCAKKKVWELDNPKLDQVLNILVV